MALYKGVEIDDGLVSLIGRMGRVEEYLESLQSLQSVWDNLTLLGHLSGTGTDMSETRTAFQQLTGSLLNQLGRETLKKAVMEMKSKAQVAVDIMIRNLFERTADIGFLAIDGEVRDYLSQSRQLRRSMSDGDMSANAALEEINLGMLKRFREYVQKYSVYSNIILLDTEGNVLLQLDSSNPVKRTLDPLVSESLSTSSGYVETFRKTDLLPNQEAGLIYSYRVTDAESGQNLGVLCLCFRFVNETERIFANLVGKDDWSVITLLDRNGQVIASSDPWHVPVGAILPRVLDADWEVLRFAGREYLAATRATQGYQGYMGPGWFGHVMMPLDQAFVHESGRQDSIPAGAMEAVMSNQELFSEALREIPVQAGRIQRGLNRSVWNGNVSQRGDRKAMNPAFSKVLLWEISNTGFKTQDVFERSIDNLHQTVVSSILQDCRFQAALAIDIMDRNLYERANDCRWWALAPVFRSVLSSGASPSDSVLRQISETLVQINGLYTVYDNLVVFDKTGCALAVSNPKNDECCGKMLNEDWVRQTLSLGDSQSYAVSGFTATPLYKGRHTYVYAAAIFNRDNEREVVGGIGIVFDAEPQFAAMLKDALPRDEKGEVPEGCFGVFADRERYIISSTHPDFRPGRRIDLDDKFFRIKNGGGASNIALFNGAYYTVGACMSGGYREYKGEGDAYRNDVVALIFVPLGEDKRNSAFSSKNTVRSRTQSRNAKNGGMGGESVEIATFYVDNHWIGIKSEYVLEAIDVKGVTGVPGAGENTVGYIMFRNVLVPVVGLWGMLGTGKSQRVSHEPQIVILELAPDVLLGVMVDELGEIPEIQKEHIEQISGMLAGENMLAESMVKPDEHKGRTEMIVVISPDRLRRKFMTMSS